MSEHDTSFKRQEAQHESHVLPITALAYLNEDVILAGEGSFMCAYHARSQGLLGSWRVFEQVIHGIVVDIVSKEILVFGGRSLNIIQLVQHNKLDLTIKAHFEIDDWILDATFDGSRAALVTAHNALHTVEAGSTQWTVTPRVTGTNTILYSAHIQQMFSKHWLVAAGTAFGDVLLWSYILGHDSSRRLHYSFSAHEGSTFGVRISQGLQSISGDSIRLLASCSDDRTVRVWDISDLSMEIIPTDRSTGFGTAHVEDAGRPVLLAKAMGHVSRIWHVRFDHTAKSGFQIRSFGEDATTITWRMYLDSGNTPYSLEPCNVQGANAGKHIWSVATHDTGVSVVGGGDGAIACVLASTTPEQELNLFNPDVLKSYAFVDEDTLLATSRQGQVAVIKLTAERPVTLHIYSRPDLANYSMVTSASGLAFAGGTGAHIYAYSNGMTDLVSIPCTQGKLATLLASTVVGAQRLYTALLIARVQGSCADFMLFQRQHDTAVPALVASAKYDVPKGFQITSSIHIQLAEDSFLSLLGSRDGKLAFFKHNLSSEPVDALQVISLHTETITSMLWIAQEAYCGHLISTSRDGTYAISKIQLLDFKIDLVHQLELPFGPNIEGMKLLNKVHLHIWGFRNKHFVVYSVTEQREIFTIDCGGVHRAYDAWLSPTSLFFVWTKASKVFTKRLDREGSRLVKTGAHGREIKSMAIHNGEQGSLIASGAQDTDIRLFEVTSTASLSCTHVLRQHNTGPQQLAFSADGDYLFSSGGFEEFFVWRLTPGCPIVGTGVVCESVHPRSGKSDLRINSFNVSMTNDKTMRIAMTYSDSRVAIWSYHRIQGWTHLCEADYLTSCPTAIFTGSSSAALWTTATDGHITMWEHKVDNIKWSTRHQAHQGAILCAEYYHSNSGSTLITGGDDNAISLTYLDPPCTTQTIRRAHAAAVTALLVATLDDTTYLISAGLDQRLIVWELLTSENRQTRAKKIQVISSCVADICSIGRLVSSQSTVRILVCGIGMEIWTIPVSHMN